MKTEAMNQLSGLQSFQLMMWSKQKFSEDCNEEELLEAFACRFKSSLPLKHIDLVFVTALDGEGDQQEGMSQMEVTS